MNVSVVLYQVHRRQRATADAKLMHLLAARRTQLAIVMHSFARHRTRGVVSLMLVSPVALRAFPVVPRTIVPDVQLLGPNDMREL